MDRCEFSIFSVPSGELEVLIMDFKVAELQNVGIPHPHPCLSSRQEGHQGDPHDPYWIRRGWRDKSVLCKFPEKSECLEGS